MAPSPRKTEEEYALDRLIQDFRFQAVTKDLSPIELMAIEILRLRKKLQEIQDLISEETSV